ncbi:MAG: diphthamide biosynthesis enzyme Dph2 [Candidatus Bathyarchaeota archaeon]|nr:diphthamide biosynthesis enzyme Dph2 [Candidatus Bathyarchaeota archaeon]
MKGFDFEEERLKQEITRLNAKRVLLQMPEGLKPEAPRITKLVEKSGALPIVSADPCYGACDLATAEAESLDADLLVHFGHAKMLKHEKVPTLYLEARATQVVDKAVAAAIPLLADYTRIGLATTVQHVQTLDIAHEILTRAGKTVEVGDAGRVPYAGQVVGCDFSNVKSIAADVDAFLFVGGGKFHALGVALATSKPTVIAEPYSGTAHPVGEEVQKIQKQRYASIQEASQAKNFGVLVSLKSGQKHLEQALHIKETVEKMGKTAFLFAVREIQPHVLIEFPTVDAYVNTACPRISLDDASRFKKPVLTVEEFRVVSGESSWANLLKGGLFEN